MKYFRQLTIPPLNLMSGLEEVKDLQYEISFAHLQRLKLDSDEMHKPLEAIRLIFELVDRYRHPEGIVGIYRLSEIK